MGFFIGFILLVAAQAYVRLSPIAVQTWHVDPFCVEVPKQNGVLERFTTSLGGQATLDAFAAAAQKTPRTTILAGSSDTGRMSFVTRSALWGFPDVTTIGVQERSEGTEVAIFARLRFGKRDFDVNGKRVAAWRAETGI